MESLVTLSRPEAITGLTPKQPRVYRLKETEWDLRPGTSFVSQRLRKKDSSCLGRREGITKPPQQTKLQG